MSIDAIFCILNCVETRDSPVADTDCQWATSDELRVLLRDEFVTRFPSRAHEADAAIGLSLAERGATLHAETSATTEACS